MFDPSTTSHQQSGLSDSSQSALLNVSLGAAIFVAGLAIGASFGASPDGASSAYMARAILALLVIIITAEGVPKLLVRLHESRKVLAASSSSRH
ncbi:hypothetical protein HDU97_002622 [Phlyctochytrium planicorne]|nr:hypothetical protein HDU97_002622 [Phlyctochytrium planicorne]